MLLKPVVCKNIIKLNEKGTFLIEINTSTFILDFNYTI